MSAARRAFNAAQVTTSEPAYRPPVSQWQSERARGEVRPMVVSSDVGRFFRGLALAAMMSAVIWACIIGWLRS